jgi:hypothetical protein
MFGMNAVPEIYQNEVRKIMHNIPGIANTSDDLVIHVVTVSKLMHDTRLDTVFKRLANAGRTLIREVCFRCG